MGLISDILPDYSCQKLSTVEIKSRCNPGTVRTTIRNSYRVVCGIYKRDDDYVWLEV